MNPPAAAGDHPAVSELIGDRSEIRRSFLARDAVVLLFIIPERAPDGVLLEYFMNIRQPAHRVFPVRPVDDAVLSAVEGKGSKSPAKNPVPMGLISSLKMV